MLDISMLKNATYDDRKDGTMANPAAKYTDESRRETADYIISMGRPITDSDSDSISRRSSRPPSSAGV